ncbi:hypothetical protein LX16_2814 [Stackebrandtia albiflava]|uniref:Uncharacterized protein n=2 Tax=Stackebrandtia albiflava TaxID=406432 RepID=A0A562V2F6_9ACTN|nr:hypothetical protein LX16_2814 [Stackebrandtia albiflava]
MTGSPGGPPGEWPPEQAAAETRPPRRPEVPPPAELPSRTRPARPLRPDTPTGEAAPPPAALPALFGTPSPLPASEAPQQRAAEPSESVGRIHAMWESADERATPRPPSPRARRPPGEPARPPRSPLLVFPAVILLAGVAAFFSWVSAAPFWMSVGHHVEGRVTVQRCEAEGFAPRCEGRFAPEGGGDSVPAMRITGDSRAERPGETVAALAVSRESHAVYIGDDTGLVLRWALGLAMVVGCGFGVAGVTGAWRFTGRRRLGALGVSVTGPLLIWLGALAMTW